MCWLVEGTAAGSICSMVEETVAAGSMWWVVGGDHCCWIDVVDGRGDRYGWIDVIAYGGEPLRLDRCGGWWRVNPDKTAERSDQTVVYVASLVSLVRD
ncbi:hypothetical protein Ddye_024399 [Dipteronia dyeriana]|uniref:Uncharacterized protein n=1 Tax=Dipteronia dyeriana TaxID=168575 RepID=A0AAD9TVB8_9ROSI|nr:hypothetical protein Ddye_024399 [Dipteronia dyeriana]